jgi:hypothetical protein
MEYDIRICEKNEDEKIKKVYSLLLKRSCENKNIQFASYDMTSSESEKETERVIDDFDIEKYIYSLQDKFNHILFNKHEPMFLKFLLQQNKLCKLQINQINFDFCSNCCVIMKISFNYTKITNKKKLCNSDMVVNWFHTKKNKYHKLLSIQHDKRDKQIPLTEMTCFMRTDKKEKVKFTVSNDIELTDNSMIIKFNYLDYYLLK